MEHDRELATCTGYRGPKQRAIGVLALVLLCTCDKHRQSTVAKHLLIELRADGRVQADGRAVTLDGLSRYAGERRRAPGARASNLDVVLRIEPDAHWQHVQWILTICMEEKLYRTWFEVSGGRRVKAYQPIGMPGEWLPGYPNGRALWATIGIGRQDGEVLYACGEETARDVAEVKAWATDAATRPGDFAKRVGEIRATPATAFGDVFPVMVALEDAALEIEFYGTAIPGAAARRKTALPRSRSFSSPPVGRGIRAVPYDPDLGVMEEED